MSFPDISLIKSCVYGLFGGSQKMNIYFFKISIFYLFVFLDWTLGCEPLKSIFNYYSHKYQTGKQENSGRNFAIY